MAVESQEITLPRVFVVTQDINHARELEAALKRRFEISVFDSTGAAGDALAHAPPDAVVVDVDRGWKRGMNWLVNNPNEKTFKRLPFVFVGKEGEHFKDLKKLFGEESPCLFWPVERRALAGAISEHINRAAEKAWEELPEIQAKPLKLTVEEYQGISDAIEHGEPINYNSAAASCASLIDAVQQNAHHDLLKSVQCHHNYTYVHSMRVATLLTLFGHGIGMKADDMSILSTGGLLHDVGKLVTPEQILDKPGKLTDEEWPTMKNHVVKSGELLAGIDNLTKGSVIIAEQHHEKIDGSGYPLGLKNGELNELARMSAIVDIFGALTDARSYKPAFPAEKAFGILESMETAIDQNLLAMFKEIFVSTRSQEDGQARVA
ncbi:MAG: HD domain-containing protein [Alphaproteobacteria bacterium]|nr:HD domain-containing protein [Alphaproteobacteria bacterium]